MRQVNEKCRFHHFRKYTYIADKYTHIVKCGEALVPQTAKGRHFHSLCHTRVVLESRYGEVVEPKIRYHFHPFSLRTLASIKDFPQTSER